MVDSVHMRTQLNEIIHIGSRLQQPVKIRVDFDSNTGWWRSGVKLGREQFFSDWRRDRDDTISACLEWVRGLVNA